MRGLRPITVIKVPDGLNPIGGATEYSEAIDLQNIASDGIFSVQVELTSSSDDGTGELSYELSNNGTDFVDPDGSDNPILTGMTRIGGPGSDGKYIASFEPEPCQWLRFKLEETDGLSSILCNIWFFIQ